MGLKSTEQTDVYEHLWRPMEQIFAPENQCAKMDSFFRDYLTMKTARIPRIDRVYETFKTYNINCVSATIKELCEDLLMYAKYYTNIVFVRSDNRVLKSLYTDIRDLRMEVALPFLLKVHNDCSEKMITEDELIEVIQMCISYVFRRSICDIPTNSLNKTFATLYGEIKTEDYMNSIKAVFVLRDDYREFPDDDKFIKAFVTRDIYNMRSRNFILSHLENYDNKAPIIIENYTIEHIMPQNKNLRDEWKTMLGVNWKEVQKEYLNTVGNLTLTAYNSEMSDHSFMRKMEMKGGFKESALRLNATLVKLTEWNEQKIKERAKILAEQAKLIWRYPTITDSELELYRFEEKPAPKYSLNTYSVNAFVKTLLGMLDRRICNLSPDVKKEFKKCYIAYKLDTNFVDINIQKQRLCISLNMKYSEINDPKGICKDMTGLGKRGNGDVQAFVEHTSDIDDVMNLIEQSYNLQIDD